jgi:tRNA pseudouridine55 synthase
MVRLGAVPATDGLVIVDKPGGMTSHDVVARMRRLAHTRKVGHAGTLDPMATGVLVLGVGKATRLLTHLVLADKAYTATIRLGQATLTDDAEGEFVSSESARGVSETVIRTAMRRFVGSIEQVPSAVSAIKVDGQRAYKRVRDGESVELPARPVHIARFEMTAIRRDGDLLDIDVDVDCSSGTYVRALARDVGRVLAVGGHLTALRRTRVGPFDLATARTLDALTLPLAGAIRAALPVRIVDEDELRALSYGKPIAAQGIQGVHGALSAQGTAVALLRESGHEARPVVVFTAAG